MFKLACTIVFVLVTLVSRAQTSIQTHEAVKIGGISQWIGAKGDDESKSLLLFLHGGPGYSSKPYASKFIKYLEKDFIVAQWDQRETGITAHWGPYDDSLTLGLFHSDTEEVVDYLLKKFSKERLYIVGYSWGGFLGLHFADQHPELLHAYVSVSSIIHGDESEHLTLAILKEKAASSENKEAMSEVSKIELPYQSWEHLYYQRKWTAHYFDNISFKDKKQQKVFQAWWEKWIPIWIAASQVNYAETIPKIDCPIYFFIGKNDFVSNYVVAKNYFVQLKSSQKQLIWFEQSTHEIPTQEPEKFANELINISDQID